MYELFNNQHILPLEARRILHRELRDVRRGADAHIALGTLSTSSTSSSASSSSDEASVLIHRLFQNPTAPAADVRAHQLEVLQQAAERQAELQRQVEERARADREAVERLAVEQVESVAIEGVQDEEAQDDEPTEAQCAAGAPAPEQELESESDFGYDEEVATSEAIDANFRGNRASRNTGNKNIDTPTPNGQGGQDPKEPRDRVINIITKAEFFRQCSDRYEHWRNGIYRIKDKVVGFLNGKAHYLQWDHVHNDVEVYSKGRKHIGSLDPKTLQLYKSAVQRRDMGV